jgi:hypothetical protein
VSHKDGLQGYDVWSLCLAEAEIDVLTGEYQARIGIGLNYVLFVFHEKYYIGAWKSSLSF